jgi:hypothetical protein
VAAVLALASLLITRPVYADTLWLDQPLKQWNQPGMPIPRADALTNEPAMDPRCLTYARPAESQMDRDLEAAGWSLFNSYQAGWGVSVITALSGHDGMCRPWGYHAFVFVDGRFAGTLAPDPSTARSDGALFSTETRIQDGDHITATFVRYADSDPLCCPSRPTVNVSYRIERGSAGPLVVADQKSETPR